MGLNLTCIGKYVEVANEISKPKLSDELLIDIDSYANEVQSANSKLSKAKFDALISLATVSRKNQLGCEYMDLVKDEAIVTKKFLHIKEASTLQDIRLIMGKPDVYNYGGEIHPKHQWVIPEEEVMVWSKTTLIAPLSQEGFDRYMKLFKELFPDKYEELQAN